MSPHRVTTFDRRTCHHRTAMVKFVVCALLFCAVGDLVMASVPSNNERDADLVFDSEFHSIHDEVRPNDVHQATKRDVDESQDPDSTGWLTRIRRQLFDPWSFFKPTTTEEPATTTTEDTVPDVEDNSLPDQSLIEKKPGASLSRETRSSDEIGADNLVDESTDDPYDTFDEKLPNGTPILHGSELVVPVVRHGVGSALPSRRKDDSLTDDEDLIEHSGLEGSASPETIDTDGPVEVDHGRAYYYRITITVNEPYRPEYLHHSSIEYQQLANNLTSEVERLYEDLPGRRSANVISIQKRDSDMFTSKVMLDLGTQDFNDRKTIHDRLYNQIQHYHKIGDIPVSTDDFNFREFEGSRPRCEPNQFPCHSGECLPQEYRCNWINECKDGSDEFGCPAKEEVAHTARPSHSESEREREFNQSTVIEHSTEHWRHRPGVTEPDADEDDYDDDRSEFIPTTPPLPIDEEKDGHTTISPTSSRPTDRCRADDKVRCAGPENIYICSDQKCDSVRDCPDGDDEFDCPDDEDDDCAEDEFMCDINRCIPKSKRCDGERDCSDDTDEHDCKDAKCGADEFQCQSGKCIAGYRRCNLVMDCPNGEDEHGCPGGSRCSHGQFACADNSQCVDERARCDSNYDCRDGSDERGCPERTCSSDEYRCPDGTCLNIAQRCDGVADCHGGEDEHSCPTPCPPTYFHCRSGECIPGNQHCNGVRNCRDSSDEQNCAPTCQSTQYTCKNGDCIDSEYLCDRVQDCSDGSDESDCEELVEPTEGPVTCLSHEFDCGNGQCIPKSLRCDRHFDCVDGKDERDCGVCAPDQFRCESGDCIDESKRCNLVDDCPDRTDELDCKFECPPEQFRCASDGLCLDMRRKCDGTPQCRDGSDERNCDEPTTSPTCHPNQFKCDNGQCISNEYHCDGFNDCVDNSDETNCPSMCRPGQIQCSDDKSCISESLKCNGEEDCLDGSDEYNCPTTTSPPPLHRTCAGHEHTCSDGTCLQRSRVCDGHRDCRDGSDEVDCGCARNEFTCRSGQCVPYSARCNNRYDCYDGSDERECDHFTPAPPPTTTTTSAPPPHFVSCRPGEWKCKSGECIPVAAVCNKRFDCNDYSDENNCEPTEGGLNIKTYPDDQIIKENVIRQGREVVFQCRDEGPLRVKVHWVRGNGMPLPPNSRDVNGRLEMPNIQVEHSGAYVCEAVGYPPSAPGSRKSVHLTVEPYVPPPTRPTTACGLHEATCENGDCIPKHLVCDNNFDCSDGSDETRCSQSCEPNEFRCSNKKCVLKTWRCDSQDDCGDGSDEADCATNPPGSPCLYHEFQCRSGDQCIPKIYHCDLQKDCLDNSDEIGCSSVFIQKPPPPMVVLKPGDVMVITCTAVAVPTPEVIWRLNWGHIPPKCSYTSVDGVGTLTCPDIQESDQGAYSCEAINIRGSVFAVPDTILVVDKPPKEEVCPAGYFNDEADVPSECISCFCFGATNDCKSADLFTYQLPPPFDTHKVVGVRVDPGGGVEVRDEPIYRGSQPRITPIDRYGVQAQLPYAEMSQGNLAPYFALPENYHGNQLKSYGGYLKYTIRFEGHGRPTYSPDVIVSGNNHILVHKTRRPIDSGRDTNVSVRFFDGDWTLRKPGEPEKQASRAEIMMALASVDNILIKMSYVDGPLLDTTIKDLHMDSAAVRNTGQGQASFVEDCRCPVGYTGLSCEQCAPGYQRHMSGPWLGKCYRAETAECKPGTYGNPNRGIPCQPCPCPLTSPSNQFARTCSLGSDGQVTCDCPPGYVGRRCEQCASGYTGNPLHPGDSCKPGICNVDGSLQLTPDADGNCMCKNYATGPSCDKCKTNTFHLSGDNQHGCIACFCMGVTKQCSSSNWYRDTISSAFTRSKHDFKIVDFRKKNQPIEDGIRLDTNAREIVFDEFSRRSPAVYYWRLPSRYLGDKVTSYGGYLNYTLRHVPLPGGQSSRNTAADVELISANDIGINLLYYGRDQPQPNSAQSFSVPLLEQYWQRSDGQTADREHLLMALADLENILIKATYTTNTREAALVSVSMDIADERNVGSVSRALEVEQCFCPEGYRGLSCEDCDVGYTRASEGIYLALCEPCHCNGHSDICDPETGVCENCRDHTTGDSCQECMDGYEGDATGGSANDCRPRASHPCHCNTTGSISDVCSDGQCQCKVNVEGRLCDRCRKGTYALSATNPNGCTECFCSGVTNECHTSNMYIEQIPMQLIDENHGFSLTDMNRNDHITTGFDLNVEMNEIGMTFPPSSASKRLYWSLPASFTGNKVTSYGGSLTYTIRYQDSPGSRPSADMDVVIVGNGITVYYNNEFGVEVDEINTVSVPIATTGNWKRLDPYSGPRPASREDLLTVLSNVESLLVRASHGTQTYASYLSDVFLDTALPQNTGQPRATLVEACRCPRGYRGTSCEMCEPGYYRDGAPSSSAPLGSCSRCPCNGNEQSCSMDSRRQVVCTCRPGFGGRFCDESAVVTSPPPTTRPPDSGSQLGPDSPTISVWITKPSIEIVNVGSTIRLQCSGRSKISSGPVSVHWSKMRGELPRDRGFDDRRGLLVITDVVVSDSGTYICQASDEHNVVQDQVTITVGGSPPEPPRVSISPQYLDVYEGEPIELRCQASGNPAPNLQWTSLGNRLNPEHTFQDGVFRIPYASKSDEGEYLCSANNSAGSHSQRVRIIVQTYSTPSPIPTKSITINPPNYNGPSGQLFTLSCNAPRNGQVTITWSRLDGSLPYSSTQRGGLLTVYDPKPEDSGIYVCTVVSTLGLSGKKDTRVTITSTTTPPVIRLEPERQTISQGASGELKCIVTGDPEPTVKWTKVGAEFGPNIHQVGQVLRIMNAQVEDRGAYVCVATNAGGSTQSSAFIEVERREIPAIEIYPESRQVVNLDASALLQCRVTAGIPSPTVVWSRADNKLITSRTEELPGGILRFNRITEEEAGQYVCRADNAAGKTEATATIEVQSSPKVTIYPKSGTITVKEGHRLRLECRTTGNPQPTAAWTKHRVSSVDIYRLRGDSITRETPLLAVHEITSVSKGDEGTYSCVAKNSAGVVEERVQVIVQEDDEDDRYPTRGDIVEGKESDKTHVDETEVRPPHPTDPYETTTGEGDEFRVPIGGRAEMRCRVPGYTEQIHLSWMRSDRKSLPVDSYEHDGVLFIKNVQPEAAGEYSCLGISTSGHVLFTAKTRLLVIAPPRIQLHPTRQIVNPGDNVVIQCTATGDQPIHISWAAVGRPLPRSVQARGGHLMFRGIEASDAGRYICTASSPTGKAESVSEVIVNKEVLPPSVSAVYRDQTTSVGSSVELHCDVHGMRTRPQMHWRRERQPLPRNAEVRDGVLHIHNIQRGDAGRYICEIETDDGRKSDYVNLVVDRPANPPQPPRTPLIPVLEVEASQPYVRLGDTVDLRCQGMRPGSQVTWTKPGSRLADNCQTSDTLLRINSVRPENAGIYRCEARDDTGVYGKNYDLNVEDLSEQPTPEVKPQMDEPVVKTAPFGSTVMLDCNSDLPPPISFKWIKQNGMLPKKSLERHSQLQISDVTATEAGTYICSATNGETTMNIPMVLVVTGVVPYFAQAPTSFISLPPLRDAYLGFNIEVSFKPESQDGLILYDKHKMVDYISLALVNGYPEFRFDCGSGPAVIRGAVPVTLGEWHTIKISRSKRDGFMYVNDQGPYRGMSQGKHQGLDITGPLYVGGLPNYNDMEPDSGPKSGFVGCISRLILNRQENDFMNDALHKEGITTCETCATSPCKNRGVCQESSTKQGYQCLCPAGFSGIDCEKIGESCYPGACGNGRCVDKDEGFSCYCPMGKLGSRCERDTNIYEPAFADDAFVAYPTPKQSRRLKLALKFNAADLKDGILLYCGEEDGGHGDFASLAIKDRHLEFRFDTGEGPIVIRSENEIPANQWITVSANKMLGEGKLIVNGDTPVSGHGSGPAKMLNLHTPLYVGGYDKERIRVNEGVGVRGGFQGCISGIEVSGMNLDLITSVTDSANIQDCSEADFHQPHRNASAHGGHGHGNGRSDGNKEHRKHSTPVTPCTTNPCQNNGVCYPISPTDYSCACSPGFNGRNCEIKQTLCESLRPCQNGGTCSGTTTAYKCNCPLGYTGTKCEQRAEFTSEVHFSGDGYLELNREMLSHEVSDENEVIALDISTNTSEGLIFWHGQPPSVDGRDQDYLSLAVRGGYAEYSWELGTGAATIVYDKVRIDDGHRHVVILKRKSQFGSIEVDAMEPMFGDSDGLSALLNCDGNIYVGGAPDIHLMTGGRHSQGFNGCVHGLEVQNSPTLDLYDKAISGVNVKGCTSLSDDDDIDNGLDIVN